MPALKLSVFIRRNEKENRLYKLILLKRKEKHLVITQWGKLHTTHLREVISEFTSFEEAEDFFYKAYKKRIKRNYSIAPKALCWYQEKLFY